MTPNLNRLRTAMRTALPTSHWTACIRADADKDEASAAPIAHRWLQVVRVQNDRTPRRFRRASSADP